MIRAFFLLLAVVLFVSCSNTIYMVRHAEKDLTIPNNPDPPLSGPGQVRATALANLLRDKKIASVFSTNTKRTKATAKPLSDNTGHPIIIYGDTLSGFVNRLKKLRSNALVVGHSNTILPMLDLFPLNHSIRVINDNDFDNLFIIKTTRSLFGASRTLKETTYGAPSPQ